jgi:hypothetical protein
MVDALTSTGVVFSEWDAASSLPTSCYCNTTLALTTPQQLVEKASEFYHI